MTSGTVYVLLYPSVVLNPYMQKHPYQSAFYLEVNKLHGL